MNWIIMKDGRMLAEEKERNYKENITKLLNNLKATEANKEQLETELAGEIGAFAQLTGDYNWFKKESKKEAGRIARELKLTQESLLDANNKATNEKTALLNELKTINILLKGKDTDKDELNKQVESIKTRLNEILNIEGRDVETVKEKRQAEHLDALQAKDLILTEEEKKALDYATGYYYWHTHSDPAKAKADKEALAQYVKDNAANITNSSVLFSVNMVIEHFNEEEQHQEDNHKYLKDLADLNNRYNDLDAKYKDKEAELVDAQNKLTLTDEEKKKISDESVKKIANLNNDIKALNEINTENYKKWTDSRDKLLKDIDYLKEQLAKKEVSEQDFSKKLAEIREELNKLNAKKKVEKLTTETQTEITGSEMADFAKYTWQGLIKLGGDLQNSSDNWINWDKNKRKMLSESFNNWLKQYESTFNILLTYLGQGERERERERATQTNS